MSLSNWTPVSKVYYVYTILIINICFLSACSDRPNASSIVSEETTANEDPIQNSQHTTEVDTSFVIFNGTGFENAPDMSPFGFTPIEIVYADYLWDIPRDQRSQWGLPSKKLVTKWARKARKVNPKLAIIDIEHWPIESNEVTRRSMQNYIAVDEMFKQAQPDLKVGYYDVVPRKNWYAEKPQRILDKWKAHNDFLAPLAQKVDAFFPCLYAYKKGREYWVKSAKLQLNEARRISGGKPVYAFLWPQYYAAYNKNLRGEYIDADFWRLQLQTVRKYADGAVIWFPYTIKWEDASKEPWWEVTKNFLQEPVI